MPDNAPYYTPAEAGVISGLGRKAIDNAIDKRLIPLLGKGKAAQATKPHSSKTWRRRLISESEVIWIYLNHAAGGAIPREDRDDLFKRYLDNLKARELRVSHLVILDLESARERILERAAKLERAKANVVSDPEVLGGEPVIREHARSGLRRCGVRPEGYLRCPPQGGLFGPGSGCDRGRRALCRGLSAEGPSALAGPFPSGTRPDRGEGGAAKADGMKLLVDECLSEKLVKLARERGHPESSHVAWLGKRSWQDWHLMPIVLAGDWTLVTRNSVDFRGPERAKGSKGQHSKVPLHAGLIWSQRSGRDGSRHAARSVRPRAGGTGSRRRSHQSVPEITQDDGGEVRSVRYALPR